MHKLPVPEDLPYDLTTIFYRLFMQLPLGELKDTVDLETALNQVNASDVYALQEYPANNLSAYTGWSINSESTQTASKQHPVFIDRLYCWGQQLYRSVNPYKLDLRGENLLRIPQYTKLPESVDAIIPEDDERLDVSDYDNKKIIAPIPAMQGIIQQGSVIEQGDLILAKNEKISPEKLIALRRAGVKELTIYRDPRILVVSMHTFDDEHTLCEESLYVKDLLKTWGYKQVEIKRLKPQRYDSAFNSLKKEEDPTLDDTLTTNWADYNQFFEDHIPNFDVMILCSHKDFGGSVFSIGGLTAFDPGSTTSNFQTRSIPANEMSIIRSMPRTPPVRETIQLYDDQGNHKGSKFITTEDKTTIINLPGDMQDIALLMHFMVKYILNKHDPDFLNKIFIKGRAKQKIETDQTKRKLLWGKYQLQDNGQYSLEIVEKQQTYQVEPFLTANCIVIVPFAEQPIQSNEVIHFIKID
ncbi:molybdenum cofactor biosysnthesis protein MoeA [Acinetobacter sp. NIPH 2699]|uniref:molybdenum cofactor biosysnthesis protein MoeA n=1 Tax=Acinetobacter sp. NIPH 2699 TaxID=2923433 RepID=UPI001F4A8C09|nr:molybdenum cofactor biosysnthesis protein MoeA [Acinetobacter sp. NIPH 2699]MCH7337428.1 molybdenum cofactor biosysnthesis protein MoeA [Acinetobacter sp. NIPH 2699]